MATLKKKAERNTKTPAERAQEALDTASRVHDAAGKRLEAARVRVTELEAEVAAAAKRRDYLGQNPDLPQQAGEPESGDVEVVLDGGTPEG